MTARTASGPLAYLTDLLRYAVDHLDDGIAPISLDWLARMFHQPFEDLPVMCDAMNTMVRQVRLCVEVLRGHLGSAPLTPEADARLAAAEQDYRLAAYTSLLERVGTTYDEVRLTQTGDPKTRAALAERLGFALAPARPDGLDSLQLDPATLTEADLERVFGLVDTRTVRNPLSDGLVLNDPQHQVLQWNLRGTEWHRNTDDNGLVHVVLNRTGAGNVRVELYRDESRTLLLASGELAGAGFGTVKLTAQGWSGLSGTVVVNHKIDTSTIALAAVPQLTALRLARLRANWQEQDRPTVAGMAPRPPSVDPHLIGPADLRDVSNGADAVSLWEARVTAIGTLMDDIKTARLAAATPAAALDAALMFPQTLGKPAADLVALEALRQGGADIGPQLSTLGLGVDAFETLIRINALVSTSPPSPVLAAEWAEVDAILAQVFKGKQAVAWRAEEAALHITLGPDFFTVASAPPITFPPPPPFTLPKWLANEDDRREWEQTLITRTNQVMAVADGMAEAVGGAEEDTIADLRDALVTAGAAGTIQTAAKSLTDRLLIDCANGTCQMTTRIAQAIETMQMLLLSVRTGQLQDTFPKLTLVAPDFDSAWSWIGSYASWRPAMLVWMWPENVADPALRDRQSPGFNRLVRDSRALPTVTPEKACALAKDYGTYFKDVCGLFVSVSATTKTRVYRGTGCRDRHPVQDRDVLHMFAPGGSGATYWATYDAAAAPDPLSFWDWVPGLQHEQAVEVAGATAYQLPGGGRYLYVFVKVLRAGTATLLFTRYDLVGGTWDTGSTALDVPGRGQDFDAVVVPAAEDRPPLLTLRHPPGGGPESAIYRRGLNPDGTGWAEGDWDLQIFSPWARIGALTVTPGTKVSAVASPNERLDLFTVEQKGRINHAVNTVNSGVWSSWAPDIALQPGASVTAKLVNGRLELFTNDNNQVSTRQGWPESGGVKWGNWTKIPGAVAGSRSDEVAVETVNTTGELVLVTFDGDGGFRFNTRTSADGWLATGWARLDKSDTVSRPPDSVGLATDLESTSVWPPSNGQENVRYNGVKIDGNHGWDTLESDFTSPPGTPVSVVALNLHRLDVFVVDGGGAIRHSYTKRDDDNEPGKITERGPKQWARVGTLAVPVRSPITVIAGATRLDLFVVGGDGRVYSTFWDGSGAPSGPIHPDETGWADWFPISAPSEFPLRSRITAVRGRPGHIDLFTVGHNGGIYQAWWDHSPDAQWPTKAYGVVPPGSQYKPFVPAASGLFELTEQLSEADLQLRRQEIRQAYIAMGRPARPAPCRCGNGWRTISTRPAGSFRCSWPAGCSGTGTTSPRWTGTGRFTTTACR